MYLCLMLYVYHAKSYGAPLWTIFGEMLGCRCDVSTFDLGRSMCQPSKIDVSTFEDR